MPIWRSILDHDESRYNSDQAAEQLLKQRIAAKHKSDNLEKWLIANLSSTKSLQIFIPIAKFPHHC